MSIILYISSKECNKYLSIDIINKLRLSCQIYKTFNYVENKGVLLQEDGFCIKIFNISDIDFKEKVWFPLKKMLYLSCAYIKKKDGYRGCILDWTHIFKPTHCSKI